MRNEYPRPKRRPLRIPAKHTQQFRFDATTCPDRRRQVDRIVCRHVAYLLKTVAAHHLDGVRIIWVVGLWLQMYRFVIVRPEVAQLRRQAHVLEDSLPVHAVSIVMCDAGDTEDVEAHGFVTGQAADWAYPFCIGDVGFSMGAE